MTESLIGTGALFHKAVNPAVVVEPVEASLNLPALTRVAGMPAFGCEDDGAVVGSADDDRDDVPFLQGAPQGITVVSFVRADAMRKPYLNSVNRTERQ